MAAGAARVSSDAAAPVAMPRAATATIPPAIHIEGTPPAAAAAAEADAPQEGAAAAALAAERMRDAAADLILCRAAVLFRFRADA